MRILRTCALLCVACLFMFLLPVASSAQDSMQALMQQYSKDIAKPSARTIGPVIEALSASGLPQTREMLRRWQDKEIYQNKDTGDFVFANEVDRDTLHVFDIDTGADQGEVADDPFSQIKPNAGVRRAIGAALVPFQLNDDSAGIRADALTSIERASEPMHLEALRAAMQAQPDPDPALAARKERLERLLTIQYAETTEERVAAIESFAGSLDVSTRGALNPLLATKRQVAETLPEEANIAKELKIGRDLTQDEAYALLVGAGIATADISPAQVKEALLANIEGAAVGGVALHALNTDEARDRAYAALAAKGLVPTDVSEEDKQALLDGHVYFDAYTEADAAVTAAAVKTLKDIETKVMVGRLFDLTLDGLSLASIYFLAAIGLAITFGVMGVINMAHGEFIMMGAYTGYVVQQIIPDYTLSLIVALPLAFAVTFAAGVAMERLVIRWLYHRPLETLLATFGISIALQQLAKNIFGTQARPLTSPAWLDGAWVLNDVVSISYIRIAIFVLGMVFLGLLLFVLKKTRLGLEVRAVSQNPKMAASMGINHDRVNMLTFGLGSGIAGIAGVAIGLFAKVTSELGQDYIVESFMTVVIGGVGNVWGTLAGATVIGFAQKGIEWFNPSNTLAAQTYMILLVILFIQFRPRGIIALKGRAAGN